MWTSPKTFVVGAVLPAADLNTHLRDNLNVTSVAVSTAAGDMTYATAANALARISSTGGSTGQILMLNAPNVPSWQAGLPKSGFFLGGTAVNHVIQTGLIAGSTTGVVTVTFPTQFSVAPNVMGIPANGSTGGNNPVLNIVSVSTATVVFACFVGFTPVASSIYWNAEGPI